MARKKKQSQTPMNTGFVYQGQVTMSVKKNGKIISSHTYKNNGGKTLWLFLCNCLAGKYTEAANFYPAKVRVYFNSKSSPTDIDPTNILDSCTVLSTIVSANTKRDVLASAAGSEDYRTTLHFTLPSSVFNQLTTGQTKIRQIMLYDIGKNNSDTNSSLTTNFSYCAYYLVAKKNSSDVLEWDDANAIDLAKLSGNYTILIDWQLSFKNS